MIRVRFFTKFDRSGFLPAWTDYWDPETKSFTAKEYICEPPPMPKKKRDFWNDFWGAM